MVAAPQHRPVTNRMSLESRFWSKVLISDGCWLWTGATDNRGYGKIGAGGDRGRTLCAHRVVWELFNGPIPEGLEIDHICHTRRCVRHGHLRLVTRKQNNENHADNGLLPLGVSRHRSGKWRARVKHHGREFHAGLFPTVEEAAAAARELRNQLFTHNDHDRAAVNPVVAL